MSTFTRITTPPFSANPFQAFVTFKQARRAAKGGGVVAFVYGGVAVLGFVQYAMVANAGTPLLITRVNLGVIAVLTVLLLVLGWRLWARPRVWKSLILLLLALANLANAFVQFSIPSLIIMSVTLNFSVIAFRGALAMKGLQGQARTQADLEVF